MKLDGDVADFFAREQCLGDFFLRLIVRAREAAGGEVAAPGFRRHPGRRRQRDFQVVVPTVQLQILR